MPLPVGSAPMCDKRTEMSEPDIDLERPLDEIPDETDINFRAYLSRISNDKLREYDPSWSDDEVIQWDGNFRCDGALMLVCCERDIEIEEYRRVLEEHIRRRSGSC